MKSLRMRTLTIVLAIAALMALTAVAAACSPAAPTAPPFPTKNITIIVPFKPGGGFDLQARILAPLLEKYLPTKVTVTINNVDGAGGRLGANELARSKADGYTLGVVGMESVAFMRALNQIEDDPRQWSFLGQLSSDPLLVAVNSKGPVQKVADFKGKDFRFGVTSEMLPSAAVITKALGGKFRPVLFDGSGDAILAARRGDLDAVVFSYPTMAKGVKDSQGQLTSLFVVNKTRVNEIKDVPTLEELGVKPEEALYSVVATSRILVGPANIDKGVQDILVKAFSQATADPDFLANMQKGQFVFTPAKPEDIKKEMSQALDEFTNVIDLVKDFVK